MDIKEIISGTDFAYEIPLAGLEGINGRLVEIGHGSPLRQGSPACFNELLKIMDVRPARFSDLARMIAHTYFLEKIKEENGKKDYSIFYFGIGQNSVLHPQGISFLEDSLTFGKGYSTTDCHNPEDLIDKRKVNAHLLENLSLKGKDVLKNESIRGLFGDVTKDMLSKLLTENPDLKIEINGAESEYTNRRYSLRTPRVDLGFRNGTADRLRVNGLYNFFSDRFPLLTVSK